MSAIATRMTLDEFLSLPETEPPSEFICGEVVQKPMPTHDHGDVAAEIVTELRLYGRSHAEGKAVIEVRFADRTEGRAYVPDVSLILREHTPVGQERSRGPVWRRPDIAIEILSPEDRPSRVSEKLAYYMRVGVPLVWIIDPDLRTLDAHRPGLPSTHHGTGDTIDARPVLRDFSLDLSQLFGTLDPASE